MNRDEILEAIMEPYSESVSHVTYRHISPEKLADFLAKHLTPSPEEPN